MKNLIVVLNDSNLSSAGLLSKMRGIGQSFTDNPTVFTNPNPPIATIVQSCDEFESAINDAFD